MIDTEGKKTIAETVRMRDVESRDRKDDRNIEGKNKKTERQKAKMET